MSSIADAGALTSNVRSLEALAGSDILFSRLGGVDADPGVLGLSALPPLADASPGTTADGQASAEASAGAGDAAIETDGATTVAAAAPDGPLGLGGAAQGALGLPGLDGLAVGGLAGAAAPVLAGVLPALGGGEGGSVLDGLLSGTALPLDGALGGLPVLGELSQGGSGAGLIGGPLPSLLAPLGDTAGGLLNEVGRTISDAGVSNGDSALQNVAGLLGGGSPTEAVSDLVFDVGREVQIVGDFVDGALETVGSALDQPLTETANDLVFDVHVALELTGDTLGASHTLHRVTDLGETIGLGHIGDDNLVTDILGVSHLLASETPIDAVGQIVSHVPDILEGAGALVTGGLLEDLGDGKHGIGLIDGDDPVGGLVDTATGLLGGAGGDPVSGVVETVTGALGGGAGGDLVGGVVEQATGLLGGAEGAAGPVADVIGLPAGLLGGDAIQLPDLGGGGGDALVGGLADTVLTPVHDLLGDATGLAGGLDLADLPDLPPPGGGEAHHGGLLGLI